MVCPCRLRGRRQGLAKGTVPFLFLLQEPREPQPHAEQEEKAGEESVSFGFGQPGQAAPCSLLPGRCCPPGVSSEPSSRPPWLRHCRPPWLRHCWNVLPSLSPLNSLPSLLTVLGTWRSAEGTGMSASSGEGSRGWAVTTASSGCSCRHGTLGPARASAGDAAGDRAPSLVILPSHPKAAH